MERGTWESREGNTRGEKVLRNQVQGGSSRCETNTHEIMVTKELIGLGKTVVGSRLFGIQS